MGLDAIEAYAEIIEEAALFIEMGARPPASWDERRRAAIRLAAEQARAEGAKAMAHLAHLCRISAALGRLAAKLGLI